LNKDAIKIFMGIHCRQTTLPIVPFFRETPTAWNESALHVVSWDRKNPGWYGPTGLKKAQV
jgi:hypothetical protein